MEYIKKLVGKKVRVFKKDGYPRCGKLLEVNSEGILINEIREGIEFLSFDCIDRFSEVQYGR